ncbi:hypothetical protein AMTRI_Chr02g215890 [Amborella trichopoda]
MHTGLRNYTRREERLHKYLKPGALAKIRDRKIHARTQLFFPSKLQLLFPSELRLGSSFNGIDLAVQTINNSNLENNNNGGHGLMAIEDVPCFSSSVRGFGPRFPQRKKLIASKAVFALPPPLSPVVSPEPRAPESMIDVFGTDLVIAH